MERLVVVETPMADYKAMLKEGFIPMEIRSSNVLMMKFCSDLIVNGVTEKVWENKRKKMVSNNRFTLWVSPNN